MTLTSNYTALVSRDLPHLPPGNQSWDLPHHPPGNQSWEGEMREGEYPILIQVSIAFYVTFSIIIAVLNAFTITAILTRPELKNVTNMFVLSLSSADLLLSPTLILVNFLPGTPQCFGVTGARIAASILLSVMYTSSGASLFSIVAIAVDRYFAVIHPYTYKQIMTAPRARVIIAVIWIYCTVFTSSLIGYFVARTPPAIVVKLSLLSVILPFWIYVGAIISQIAICIIVSVALYVRIFIAIRRRHQTSVTLRGRSQQNDDDNRRVTLTMALVLGALIISWTPYTVLSVTVTQQSISQREWLVYLAMATILLLYSNSFMNPIIYASRCTNFRQAYWCMMCYACRVLMTKCQKQHEAIALSNNIKSSKDTIAIESNHVNSTLL